MNKVRKILFSKNLLPLVLLLSQSAFGHPGWSGGPGGFGDESASGDRMGEGERRGPAGHPHGGRKGPGGPGSKADLEACASSLGITLPERGSGTKLADADRENLKSCVKAKREEKRAVMDACLKEAGVEFGENGRPSSRPSRDQMEACRTQMEGDGSSTVTDTSTDTSTDTGTTSAI